MNYAEVPIWEKYTLTIEEAAKYFRIGEKKLRQLADEHPNANWLIKKRGLSIWRGGWGKSRKERAALAEKVVDFCGHLGYD